MKKKQNEEQSSYEEIVASLDVLCRKAWATASSIEQDALRRAANVKGEASPLAILSAIAHQAKSFDPALTTLLYDELEVKLNLRRMEIDDVSLSREVAEALQLVMAYELGQRIDRALAELGDGETEELTQDALEARAGAYGVPWQVISYAMTRQREGHA